MIGPRIAALRRSAGWSQAELAKQLQVSPSTVGMYEQGRREPAGEILVALGKLFGVSTDYLLTGKSHTPAETQLAEQALLHTLQDADKRLEKRDRRPFTRQELLVLITAMLMDA